MKTLNYILLVLFLALPVQAEELLRPVTLSSATDDGTLRVSAQAGQPQQLLIELNEPGISSSVYALKGMIRYEGVVGDGYLHLDNHFGDRGTYFTKSLAASGPLKKISGSSDWRTFVLPFYASSGDEADDATPTPEKLSLSIYLPGDGTVTIRDVGLYQYTAGEDPLQAVGQWISSSSAILIGAIGGSLIGVWGGLIAYLTSRGKARGFVLNSANLLIALGAVSLVAGIVALASAQPYAVYYSLLLIGIIVVAVVGSLRRRLPERYEAMELQKMKAMDA